MVLSSCRSHCPSCKSAAPRENQVFSAVGSPGRVVHSSHLPQVLPLSEPMSGTVVQPGDATFDIVSANMVVEHLSDPGHTLAEIHRVLKPGGRFVFHTPSRFHWPLWLSARVPEAIRLPLVRFLENRRSEDVFPTHYQMND